MKKLKILFILVCAIQHYYLLHHRSNFNYEIIKNPFHKDAGVIYALSPAVIESKEIIKNQGLLNFNLSEDLNSFSTEKLNSLREQQKAIFINFTADWCITCKVNESIALDQKEVKKLLDEKKIVYLKADWTKKDPEIASILTEYGRTGVPLYLLFPPVGEAIILPELLTEDLLLDFLNKIN